MPAKNILVVDDEAIIGVAFKRELEEKGYLVDAVLNGPEALKAVKLKAYDLVFIDLVLSGMDGIEVCREIRKINTDIPLFFMTGRIDNELIYKEMDFCAAGGTVAFLYKPFSRGEIVEVTERALNRKIYE